MRKLVLVATALGLAFTIAAQAQDRKPAMSASAASTSAASAAPATAAAQDSEPETVVATFHVRVGKEKEFLASMQQNWPSLRRLGLVLPEPHLLLRGTEDSGKPVFIEVLTWVDHDAADHVPAEIQKVWNELQAECESRDGHPGIDIPEFEVVALNP